MWDFIFAKGPDDIIRSAINCSLQWGGANIKHFHNTDIMRGKRIFTHNHEGSGFLQELKILGLLACDSKYLFTQRNIINPGCFGSFFFKNHCSLLAILSQFKRSNRANIPLGQRFINILSKISNSKENRFAIFANDCNSGSIF